MQDLDISETRTDDIPAIGRIVRDTGLFPPEMVAELLAEGQAEGHIWLTARDDQQVLGLVFGEPEPLTDGTWNMRALAVAPSSQGLGVGKALVRTLEQALNQAGHRLLLVDTSGTDAFAETRAFYRATGYRQVAEIADYWGEGDAKITFAKVLS
ncbi:MAG: GNAT family N-acetyltransferase [Dinoroseobacter sp.]|nr:GNAT family N-acetyltransferase [Dinoroseobacter sp.]